MSDKKRGVWWAEVWPVSTDQRSAPVRNPSNRVELDRVR
jgi:hypothetical protein